MRHGRVLVAALVCLALVGTVVPGATGQESTATETAVGAGPCESTDAGHLCLAAASVGSNVVELGESTEISYTVENRGDDVTAARVQLTIAGPNNETRSLILEEGTTLTPGESTSGALSLTGDTVGLHALQFRVVTPDGTYRFDESEPLTVDVVEDRTRLGGDLDAPDFALLALVATLTIAGVLGLRIYRQRRRRGDRPDSE
ncbi:hypothetical protein RYH80_03675 [Halobaculum sp. MBLA0147]|uniref:hypothetical protein n=1 Tax=Halobaculum sp. MBLA0147 TaxID=3079934 RepID=UPI0035255BC7